MNGTHQNRQSTNVFFFEDGIDLNKIFNQLRNKVWYILAASVCTGSIAFLHTLTIKQQYQSAALLQVNEQTSNNSIKIFQSNSGSILDTQQALIKTSYILEPVIKEERLNISVSPNSQNIEIQDFSVPKNLMGKTFKLTIDQENSYQLYNQNQLVLKGKIGESVSANHINLRIKAVKAKPGTTFSLTYRNPVLMVDGLAKKIQISDVYGNSPMSTGIFQVKFTDTNPEFAEKILNTIIQCIVEKNIQKNIQKIGSSIVFLKERLPDVKNNLDHAENELTQYHIDNNTIGMLQAGQVLMIKMRAIEQSIDQLKTQKAELLQIYTPKHPLVLAAQNKEMEMGKRLEEIKKEIQKFLPESQKELNLMRNTQIVNATYLGLLKDRQKLDLAKAGVTSDVVILSNATPARPLANSIFLKVLGGFLIGAFIASMIIIVKNLFNKTVDDTEHLEDTVHIPVKTVIPFSYMQKKLERARQKNLYVSKTPLLLAKQEPNDISIESLRSLRISLHFMSSGSNHEIIALMGSSPNIGKSFVSLNFAQVYADAGKRTLIVDADIRKGRLHHALHQTKSNGLSEYLEGLCEYERLVRPIHENLFFIPCGEYKEHPLILFQSPRFQDFIEQIRKEFDQVIIDTAPILSVTDAILIAHHCDTKLFVVSAGEDKISDVKQAIKKARTHGVEIDGIVLNHRKAQEQGKYQYTYGAVNRA